VLSLIVLNALEARWSRESLLWFSAKATPLLLILFCMSRNLWLSVVLLGLFGGMQIIFRTVSRLIIQIETPRELLGRVMSVFLMDQGKRSLGSMVMGAFVTIFGAALGLALTSAASMTLTAITFWRLLGRSTQKAVENALELFQNRGEQQWHHDFHVAGEMIALAAVHGRPVNHIGQRAVVLQEIKVDRGQIPHRVSEVAR
jgi:transmembrane secretion effector